MAEALSLATLVAVARRLTYNPVQTANEGFAHVGAHARLTRIVPDTHRAIMRAKRAAHDRASAASSPAFSPPPRITPMSRRSTGAPTRVDPRISLSTVYRTHASCSRPAASWSATISAPAAAATRKPPGRHHDHLIDIESGRGDRVPQRGDRAAAGAGGARARVQPGRPQAASSTACRIEERAARATQSTDRRDRARNERSVFVKTFGCQMNVYDQRAHDGAAGAARLCRDRRPSRTPTSSSSTPAISARRRPRRSIPTSAASAS